MKSDSTHEPETETETKGALGEVFRSFLKLGLISFGGPVAHLGYFHEEFVVKRRWLDDPAFGDLVALCQFLPGPASSQIVFALGMRRAGIVGALVASLCFMLPSVILMILFAYGISALGDLNKAGWLHGLKLAAVAVVAQAVWSMGRKLCPDRTRLALCLGATGVALIHPGSMGQIGALLSGAFIGWWLYRGDRFTHAPPAKLHLRAHWIAAACLVTFFALLMLLPVLSAATHRPMLAMFDGFYRAGSLVFGGGHVVLPLLRAEVVPNGWVHDDVFLAGYGAAQAVPGPLFTFAGYLGAVIHPGPYAWLSGLWCLLAIFLPAWLILGGALPFWDTLRRKGWMQAALRGANAAVVGILLAALYRPISTEAIRSIGDIAAVLAIYAMLELWKLPPWLAVVAAAAAGQWMLV